MEADEATRLLVDRVRARPWGLAVAAIADGGVSLRLDAGDDPLDPATTFQWGSITKTITGVLLGYAIETGELRASSTLGDVLGVSGRAASITVTELATQRSGLPRLPPNLDLEAVDRHDPYSAFSEHDLRIALTETAVGAKEHAYSNFGFMALGLVVATAGGAPFASLVEQRLASPLGMRTTGCPPPEHGRIPGYNGATRAPWWSAQVPGAGGVGGSIADLATYLRAHLELPPDTLGAAIERATTIQAGPPNPRGYGWGHQGGGWWHNGGTGGFRSFAAFHRPTKTAVALLANSAQADVVDSVGFATLTEMVKARA